MSLKKLGRYDLVRVLGKGAMGIVYEGRDPNLDRRVAIKTVKVENLSEEAAAEYEHRFRTEARSAARLQHPNIVSVYDSDRDGDIAFLVMEYIQGDDLKHHLDKGVRYSLEQSLKMIRDLLSALDYAHKQSIVHRDVKPANLLIEPGGRVKLTDFGVARIQDSGEATRTQGSMVGTLKYMSPEQVQGQKIDSRADLFSVGVVLYQLLTDKRPFDGDNDFSIIHQIIGHTPPPPSSFNSRLPSAIDAVVARALAKDREQRFATARDFATALQSAIRRAEDATVVPPANPFKKDEPAASKGHQTGAGISATAPGGSTVTQELELVYWKDIKDSTEPDEIELFLAKFPDGIYADLARKRLRKLAPGGASPDQTMLSGTRVPADQDLDATRLLHSGTTPSFVAPPPTAPPPAATAPPREPTIPPAATPIIPSPATTIPVAAMAPVESPAVSPLPPAPAPAPAAPEVPPAIAAALAANAGEETDFTKTIVQPRVPEPEPVKADDAIPPPVRATASSRPARREAKPAAGAPKKKLPVAVLAGIGAVAVAGIAALLLLTGRGTAEKVAAAPMSVASAPASGAASALVISEPPAVAAASEPVASVPAAVAQPVAAASVPMAKAASAPASRPASAPRRPASAVRARAASAPVFEAPRVAAPTPVPHRDETRPAPPSAVTAVGNPAEACRDKVFLSKEFCLAEQCDKPGARNHPLCVKRREEARLREDSKVRN
ncbi:MAG: protein kinase (serine/threonine-protein kinase)-like protein [Ramlibacter sp.]|nr:protein kinase (serine/threonine-protein kinase)-like protein [Ramlibacter sp.]